VTRADDIRARIATEQGRLVSALLNSGPLPEGFDSRAVQATAISLVQKRLRAIVRTWPMLAQSLAPRLAALFQAYAQEEPLPQDGSLADGRAFVHWVTRQSPLPDACLLEAMTVDLHYRATAKGLVARRWLGFKVAWLPESRRLFIGVWLPFLGKRWWPLPVYGALAGHPARDPDKAYRSDRERGDSGTRPYGRRPEPSSPSVH
jgi:hypothetical protein